jgi:hypothetical protein
MRSFIGIAARLLDPFFRRLEKYRIFLRFKYFIFDKYLNKQEEILGTSIKVLNSLSVNHIIAPIELPKEEKLGQLFSLNGSDKSTRHNYHQVYGVELGSKRGNILEIGLGSHSTNQYASGKPGGGLLSLQQINSNLNIFGADIDEASVEEVVFPAFVVDQTDEQSLEELTMRLQNFGDFIAVIDDGFHEFSANVQTFLACKKLLTKGGLYFIEDVHESHIELWNLFIELQKLDAVVIDLRLYRPNVPDNILIKINL